MKTVATLILEDGSTFEGISIGVEGSTSAEIVFNTSMTGYQEILTDPSYAEQIVLLTYPHIGNTGVNIDDNESNKIYAKGLIIRDLSLLESSWRKEETLSNFLKKHNIVAIANIDTRALTNLLREKGALKGSITTVENTITARSLQGLDLAKEVSTKEIYNFEESSFDLSTRTRKPFDKKYNIAVYDFGVKRNILNMLVDRGCSLTIYPAQTPVEEILRTNVDGVFLSNGPGDPEPCDYAISNIKVLLEKDIPIFGICLGYQLLSLATGAKTQKMLLGHHGANHPVQDLKSKKVVITSQNHGFTVSENDLGDDLEITHRSLFDNTIQGIQVKDKKAFGFQGHPEASPGPHDVSYLFDNFIGLL
ncbi:Carbamoyl-phosphate synthase small chain [hydrothermal vent metagenome]|uniref:carbamoyl-phosphate synthase (glutamine-hydrolyzing) n=1 Tax=hydrothermal vent metagenome TaxID=652676 RepID=A0A1W1CG57_9ZZZZ